MYYQNSTRKRKQWRVEAYGDYGTLGREMTIRHYHVDLQSALREAKALAKNARQVFQEKVVVYEETCTIRFVNGVMSIALNDPIIEEVVYEGGYENGLRVERFDGGISTLRA